MIREQDSKYRFKAVMNEDSRDFAVDAGDDIRETRIAWASGIVGGEIAWARIDVGWDKFAKSVGGRWISPGLLEGEAYNRT
jgi:hypothetical protein